MSWTATINSVGPDSAGIAVSVTFTSSDNPPRTSEQVFHFQTNTPEDVQNAIQAQIDQLTAQDGIVAAIAPGPFVAPTPPTPSNAQLAQQAYQQAVSDQAQVQQAVTAGAIQANDPLVATAATNVQSAWSVFSSYGVLQAQLGNTATAIAAIPIQAQPPKS